MSEPDYQKYCLHANFVGDSAIGSAGLRNIAGGAEFGALIPGAIGFVRAIWWPGVKVVKIDGMSPGDAGIR